MKAVHFFSLYAAVVLTCIVSVAYASFALRPDAGRVATPAELTAKVSTCPAPLTSRDTIVSPWIGFSRVTDIVPAVAATPTVPAVPAHATVEPVYVLGSEIVEIAAGHEEFKGYAVIVLRGGSEVIVLGDPTYLVAYVARATGTQAVAVTFDEK